MATKIIIITLVCIVTVMATGIASAYSLNIAKDPFYIGGGNVDSSTVSLLQVSVDKDQYITATTSTSFDQVKVCITGFCDDNPSKTSTGWSSDTYSMRGTTSHAFVYKPSTVNDDKLTVYVKGSSDGRVYITMNQGLSYSDTGEVKSASASADTQIPEFPTIALPVAAAVGLVLFIQQRKEKKSHKN